MSIFNDNLAIVASGRSLLNSNYGAAIDQFDGALRFNSALVKGHEADVGQFYTHWCCNFTSKHYIGIRDFLIDDVVCCDRPFGQYVRFDFKKLPCPSVMYIPPKVLDELCGRYIGMFTPSSGLRLLWWIYRETGKKIDRTRLFGFDCFGTGNKLQPGEKVGPRSRKYYKSGDPCPKHVPKMERAIINEITT